MDESRDDRKQKTYTGSHGCMSERPAELRMLRVASLLVIAEALQRTNILGFSVSYRLINLTVFIIHTFLTNFFFRLSVSISLIIRQKPFVLSSVFSSHTQALIFIQVLLRHSSSSPCLPPLRLFQPLRAFLYYSTSFYI